MRAFRHMANKQEILTLKANIREADKKDKDSLSAVLYGPKTKNQHLSLDYKEFERILAKAGESSVINLEIEGQKEKHTVLVHEIQKGPLTGKAIHIDLYQPDLTKKVSASVPLVIVGIAPAVKEFGGTLIKNFSEVEVKALPMDLPHEIEVDVSILKNLHDEIKIKDIQIPEGVEIERNLEDVIALVTPPADVEAELAKPVIEEEGKEPELIREKKEEEVVEEATPKPAEK